VGDQRKSRDIGYCIIGFAYRPIRDYNVEQKFRDWLGCQPREELQQRSGTLVQLRHGCLPSDGDTCIIVHDRWIEPSQYLFTVLMPVCEIARKAHPLTLDVGSCLF
jgi:hypothetical protein